jgi:hypothetical protein
VCQQWYQLAAHLLRGCIFNRRGEQNRKKEKERERKRKKEKERARKRKKERGRERKGKTKIEKKT